MKKILALALASAMLLALVACGNTQPPVDDPAVTTAAFSGMVDNIEAGEPVRQAFIDFCKEIIINAN